MKLQRKRAAEWEETIRQWQASGLSIRKYCLENRLRESRFYWWRKQLANIGKVNFASPAASGTEEAAKPIEFLPVRIKQAEIGSTTSRGMVAVGQRVDIFLSNGTVMRLNGDMSEDKLSLIMQMVAGAPC